MLPNFCTNHTQQNPPKIPNSFPALNLANEKNDCNMFLATTS